MNEGLWWRRTFPRTAGVCTIQGWYYLISGAWPLVHSSSFETVTGPKRDLWLAQTVGLFLVVVGLVMISAAKARRITREIALLAMGVALALLITDVVSQWQPRTQPAYLFDATAEMALIAAWLWTLLRPNPRVD